MRDLAADAIPGGATPAGTTPVSVRRGGLLENERSLGYVLVLPAVVYLAVFIAYPFLMSIYLSLSDAQAGNQQWRFQGFANYSKVTSYEGLADDFVVATLPDEGAARALVNARGQGTVVTDAGGDGRTRAALQLGARTVPLLEMPDEKDASFLADTILNDFDWQVRRTGGAWTVVAHAKDEPVSLGQFDGRGMVCRRESRDERTNQPLIVIDQPPLASSLARMAERIGPRPSQASQLGQHAERPHYPWTVFLLAQLTCLTVALCEKRRCQMEHHSIAGFELCIQFASEISVSVQTRHLILVLVRH